MNLQTSEQLTSWNAWLRAGRVTNTLSKKAGNMFPEKDLSEKIRQSLIGWRLRMSRSRRKRKTAKREALQNSLFVDTMSSFGNTPSDTRGEKEDDEPVVVSSPALPRPESQELFEDAKSSPEIPQPPSFVSAGLTKKASPLEFSSWSSMVLKLDGRDKVTKIVQYASRLLGWWFAGGPHKAQAARFMAMYKSFGTSRKAFRMGRSFLEIEKLWKMGLSSLFVSSKDKSSSEWWVTVGTALKLFGVMGFWAGDNTNFLCSSGALDDYSLPTNDRLARRKKIQTFASNNANLAYFYAVISGLMVNAYGYLKYKREKLAKAQKEFDQSSDKPAEVQEKSLQELRKVKEKQFALFLGLVKGCADAVVFSNNPGVDLHMKYRGKKNHEGLHCLLGLVSASTVLYSNFPDN